MIATVSRLKAIHDRVFATVERATASWLPGLFARFAIAAVLLVYYWNSFATKVGDGIVGFFSVAVNAYYQIVPAAMEAASGDASQVGLLDTLIVYAGTYGEFFLPLAVVIGLFTRLAALGMMGFITVQSLVDVYQHKIGAEFTGAWFDRFSDALILDQRLMWFVPLVYLVVRGAGLLSVDALLAARFPEPASIRTATRPA